MLYNLVMRRSSRPAPYEGKCSVTPLLPPPAGWRGLVNRGPCERYDFGDGMQEWRPSTPTLGYILPEAVVINYPKRERRDRIFVGLLITKTGHIAIAGVLSGWRLAASEVVGDKTVDIKATNNIDEPAASAAVMIEIPEVEGATRLNKMPRLVIPESRLIPVAEWKRPAHEWPELRNAHGLPPDGEPKATIRDPARAAQAFAHIQANPGGLS